MTEPGAQPMSTPGQPPLSQSDERLWAMLAHLAGIVITVIGALVIMLVFGPRSSFVKNQSTEALNFQITTAIAVLVSSFLILIIIGLVLLPIVVIGALVFMIIGGIKAYNGEEYRYPINIRIVK
ncbi:MAG: DUF4870 domain-containing protein [Candidatus Nanopelagicales bacterium]|jgi:uncharacterized Tic20 family protein